MNRKRDCFTIVAFPLSAAANLCDQPSSGSLQLHSPVIDDSGGPGPAYLRTIGDSRFGDAGVRMYSVRRLALAATAGIRPGDMIVAIDDQDVASVSSLAANVG